jgi:hypothetical protein
VPPGAGLGEAPALGAGYIGVRHGLSFSARPGVNVTRTE